MRLAAPCHAMRMRYAGTVTVLSVWGGGWPDHLPGFHNLNAASGTVARSLTCALLLLVMFGSCSWACAGAASGSSTCHVGSAVPQAGTHLRQALKERALVPRAPPSRTQLLICAFLAGVLITAVRACHLCAHISAYASWIVHSASDAVACNSSCCVHQSATITACSMSSGLCVDYDFSIL